MSKVTISIITPTYNRVNLLSRLYMSLCEQIDKDFEWVVIDDGSTDNTCYLMAEILGRYDKPFSVQYRQKRNGGKHTAINEGVKYAQGKLVLILDSDDSLPKDSVSIIKYFYNQIEDDESFGGVCGYMAHHDGTIIGHGNDSKILDANSIDMRYKYHIQGDMLEVFRTSVLREFPFPEIENEKFVPEALVWNRIACKYQLRIFHEVVYFRDYLTGGLTDKIVKIRMNSPIASMMTYAELNGYHIPFVSKVKAAINYWRFRFCSKVKGAPKLAKGYFWTMPIGFFVHLMDVIAVKKIGICD